MDLSSYANPSVPALSPRRTWWTESLSAWFSIVSLLFLSLPAPSIGQDKTTPAANESRPANLPENINADFLNPQLNVDEFVKRFEVESREVFACREQILKSLQLSEGLEAADVGAGTGLYMAPIAKSIGEKGTLYAVDIAPQFVKHLRQRAKDEMLGNVEVVLCSDRDANLKPNSVDRIFICDVYHHFEFPKSTMASLYAALRPGGKLILVDFNRIEGESREWTLKHVRAGKEVFKQEVIDVGFQFEEEIAIDGFKENYLLRFTK